MDDLDPLPPLPTPLTSTGTDVEARKVLRSAILELVSLIGKPPKRYLFEVEEGERVVNGKLIHYVEMNSRWDGNDTEAVEYGKKVDELLPGILMKHDPNARPTHLN